MDDAATNSKSAKSVTTPTHAIRVVELDAHAKDEGSLLVDDDFLL